MDNTLKFELTSDDTAEIKKLLEKYIEEFDRSHAERAKVWEEIDRTNAANEAARTYLRELMRIYGS